MNKYHNKKVFNAIFGGSNKFSNEHFTLSLMLNVFGKSRAFGLNCLIATAVGKFLELRSLPDFSRVGKISSYLLDSEMIRFIQIGINNSVFIALINFHFRTFIPEFLPENHSPQNIRISLRWILILSMLIYILTS